ncbi:hypothetical protein ABNG03_01205 [Halorubrum sp. RMP-47]|uniref:Uncharacterized protein n=1 Tax=Halorubrum miltondacostae TaxID=3076378 RepID=A0ABD5M0G2_9EURY
MSLSTDTLLFSIVLMLFGVQTALPVTEGGASFLFAGLGLAVLALVGSVVMSIRDADT